MAYPKITVQSANAVLGYAGIEIKQHFLGYYVAEFNGHTLTAGKLQDLVKELMETYFHIPEQRQSPDALTNQEMIQAIEDDYQAWAQASEKRHTDAGIL
jgi:hypothetical protein